MAYEPLKPETQEQYLKIWTHYAVGHFTKEQLAKLFDCSHDTIANAIEWCADNRLQLKTPVLAEAAKEAVEARLRELRNDLVRVREKEPVNYGWVLGINKQVKENEELLWKLQAVIQDKSSITINTTQVNQVIKARDEIVGRLTDDERREVATRIREITGKPNNN
jgi:hypothetical protein